MRRLLLAVMACALMSGCAPSNMTDLVKALSADPATACVTAQTPYGTIAVGRSNPQNQDEEVAITGGSCEIKRSGTIGK